MHWNFFFTLAGLPLLLRLTGGLPGDPVAVGAVGLAVYQAGLSLTGATEWVMGPDRSTLVAAAHWETGRRK